MKKNIILLILALMLFSSCTSTVALNYKIPAKIDMSEFDTIAVTPTVSYPYGNNFSQVVTSKDGKVEIESTNVNSMQRNIASSASRDLYNKLSSSSFYKVVYTESNQFMGSLVNSPIKGIDAVITPEITSIQVNERIEDVAVKVGEDIVMKYYLYQDYYIRYKISVYGSENNALLYASTEDYTYSNKTQITENTYFTPSNEANLMSFIYGENRAFVNLILPHTGTRHIDLMKNYEKVEYLEAAYKAVDRNQYAIAYDIFNEYYKNTHYIPAGYNAALLLASFDRFSEAIALLKEVYSISASPDVYKTVLLLEQLVASNNKTDQQLEKLEKIN